MHGGGATSHQVSLDGAGENDPAMHEVFIDIDYDSMEEMEVASGGLPAQVGNTSGGFINIVTNSGGNAYHGQLQGYYTNENLVGYPIPDYQIQEMGVVKPAAPILDFTTSGNLGGPILTDRLWFYSSLSYQKTTAHGAFIPTTILGKYYGTFNSLLRQWDAFTKLTTQISPSMRFFAMFAYVNRFLPYSSTSSVTTSAEAIQQYIFRRYSGTANLSWLLGPNTILDAKAGGSVLDYPIPMQPGTEDSPRYNDAYTGYTWGAATDAEPLLRVTSQGNLQLTHYVDNLLGGNHEFKLGVEFKTGMDHWNWFRGGQQISTWSYYNGNPYYYRGLYGLSGPSPTNGDGRLSFRACAATEGDTYVEARGLMLGGFVQDSWTIGQRLTLNLGLRVDSFSGKIPSISKKASSDLPKAIGAYYFAPIYGLNPFGDITVSAWNNPWAPTMFSPRIGLSYDLFGNGKTAVKASYSVYREDILVSLYEGLHPFNPRSFTFDWWDLNNNGLPDVPPTDKYNPQPADVSSYSEAYFKQKINPDMKAAKWQEGILGVQHELARDLNVGVKYIYKVLMDPPAALLYDPNAKKYLYNADLASGSWVPFTTIVPAMGSFAQKTVTLYFQRSDAPTYFTLTSNLPGVKTTYNAFEFTFNKRMSNGWQLGGSAVVSKLYGIGGDGRNLYEGSGSSITPNYWVNRAGRKSYDRPFVVKFFGTASLPYDVLASLYYIYEAGSPFGRTVTVYAPSSWVSANNVQNVGYSINVDPVGTRRIQAYSNLDFRLEKKIKLDSIGTLGLYADVLNLLSNRIVYVQDDPGGTWRPTDVNTNAGTYTPTAMFGKVRGIEGFRVLKLSARFTF